MKTRQVLLFLLYSVITALVAIHYMLSTWDTPMYSTVMFYLVAWTVFLTLLGVMEIFHVPKWTEWTEDLGRKSFPVWLLGLAGMVACASFIPKLLEGAVGLPSAILVPTPLTTLAQTDTGFLTVSSDVLFNMTLVGGMEQLLQLVASIIVYAVLSSNARLKDTVWPTVLAIFLPVLVWAVSHTYQSYIGPEALGLTAAAVGAGLVMMGVLKATKSLLAVWLLHGSFNALVILLPLVLRMLGINF